MSKSLKGKNIPKIIVGKKKKVVKSDSDNKDDYKKKMIESNNDDKGIESESDHEKPKRKYVKKKIESDNHDKGTKSGSDHEKQKRKYVKKEIEFNSDESNKKKKKSDNDGEKSKTKKSSKSEKKHSDKENKKNKKKMEKKSDDKDDIKESIGKSEKKDKSKTKRILEIKTTQTGAFKQVIERISGIISDCCIIIIPQDENIKEEENNYYDEEVNVVDKKSDKKNKQTNPGGMRILRLTEDRTILIKLSLDASNFEYFYCGEPKIMIGVDMHNFHTSLKTINDDNSITLYMNKDNRSILYISSDNETNEGNEETDIELFLMDINDPKLEVPRTQFQNRIRMAADKFHSICKNLNINSVYVEIKSVGNSISFKGQNEGGKVTKSFSDVNCSQKKKNHSKECIVQGVYELRNLMCFSKCNKLCNVIDIYLKNDFPLVLVIDVAKLGRLYIFVTPIEVENSN
jgi:proliferating cell nuclear antigen PCNA